MFQREQLFLSVTKLHAKNTMASIASLKLSTGKYEERFITINSLKGIYWMYNYITSVALQGLLLSPRKKI